MVSLHIFSSRRSVCITNIILDIKNTFHSYTDTKYILDAIIEYPVSNCSQCIPTHSSIKCTKHQTGCMVYDYENLSFSVHCNEVHGSTEHVKRIESLKFRVTPAFDCPINRKRVSSKCKTNRLFHFYLDTFESFKTRVSS